MPAEIDETPSRPAARAFVGSAVALVVAGTVALLTRQPWLFPSLWPAIMLHVEQPRKPESSPRNTLIGHLVALLAGYVMLVVTGLTDHPPALQEGVSGARIVAAAGSLALTAGVLVLLRAAHPPAGATTLIVSLGLLRTPTQLVIAFAAVVLVTVVDLLFNRSTGRQMPLWSAPKEG
ncbi:HPP family protein [Micromonospora purpureochromogenes]|uniref:HPP family protein n=1 Tax=Micromonospora purpureochromogenes TaxID=47872 RepID=A0A1C4WJB5_9ACTN|nr:HPP family protein [Micromonospora purpureochromogenes]SCE96278.1 HPP family protein [Micromonospora purpureochromogenes]